MKIIQVKFHWFPWPRDFSSVQNITIKKKLKTNSDPKLSIWPVKDGASLYNDSNYNYDNSKINK